jgi:hypothetical protein
MERGVNEPMNIPVLTDSNPSNARTVNVSLPMLSLLLLLIIMISLSLTLT